MICLLVAGPVSLTQANDRRGDWGPVFDWGLPGRLTTPIHMSVVVSRPDGTGPLVGQVLTHGYYGTTWSYLWNPQTQRFTLVDFDPGASARDCGDGRPDAMTSLFCSGHCVLADGSLLVAGGDLMHEDQVCALGYAFAGAYTSFTFDPLASSPGYTRAGDMNQGRWYPTNTMLGDGRVVTFSGLTHCASCDENGLPIITLNTDVEVYDPASRSWGMLSQRELPLYPWMHLLSSGRVFYSGPGNNSQRFNPSNGTWSLVSYSSYPYRSYGTSVLYPAGRDQVMVVGGACCGEFATPATELIDLSRLAPRWQAGPSLRTGRTQLNAVLLPDGSILAVGGRSDYDFGGVAAQPVYRAERLDPFSSRSRWKRMARMARPRMYHSTAVLLPDGRVLSAGGTAAEGYPFDETNAQVYSPPYLFRGPRPEIRSAPERITYGETFAVEPGAPGGISSVVLMRPSSVTHTFNMEQRYVALTFAEENGVLRATAPATGESAPPGYYMLFILDSDRVPSTAAWVRLDR